MQRDDSNVVALSVTSISWMGHFRSDGRLPLGSAVVIRVIRVSRVDENTTVGSISSDTVSSSEDVLVGDERPSAVIGSIRRLALRVGACSS